MSKKELRKTIKALSHLPKEFIIEKLHNLAVEYQNYLDGKYKKAEELQNFHLLIREIFVWK